MVLHAAVVRSLQYLVLGLRMLALHPWLFLQIVLYFSAPAILAACLAGLVSPHELWRGLLLFLLQGVTIVVAPVVFMMAVSAACRDEAVSFGELVRRSAAWLPRYLWTNLHTSVIFWIPVGSLLALRAGLEAPLLAAGVPGVPLALGWLLLLSGTAVYFHARTLLAPFLAIHANLPGTRATLTSWRLSGQHLAKVLSTFLICAAPTAPPFVLLTFVMLVGEGVSLGMREVLAQLVGVTLQLVRVTLIPPVHYLYTELWQQELARRGRDATASLSRAVSSP